MLAAHMSVYALPVRERLQAHPADMRFAHRAHHMVTPLVFLYRNLTTWTLLDVMLACPISEKIVSAARLGTSEAIVRVRVAVWTNPKEASRALDEDAFRCGAVYLGTVRSGAEIIFVLMGLDMCRESCVDDSVKVPNGQQLSCRGQRNAFRALSFVSKTSQREEFVINGCH